METENFYSAPDAICTNVHGPMSAKIYRCVQADNVVLGEHTTVGDFSRLGDVSLAEHVALQRNNMLYGVNVGRYTYTGRNTTIWHAEIGAFCSISWNVSIGGANHDFTRTTTHSFLYSKDFGLMPEGEVGYDRFSEPCVIGNDVWIAAGVCVCRGVHVGDGAVLGAGAVVTKDVEPYTVVAGVPARPIRKRFSTDVIQRLQATQWWNLPENIIRDNYFLFNAEPEGPVLDALERVCNEFRKVGI